MKESMFDAIDRYFLSPGLPVFDTLKKGIKEMILPLEKGEIFH